MLGIALALALGNVVTLDSTSEILEITTSSTATTD